MIGFLEFLGLAVVVLVVVGLLPGEECVDGGMERHGPDERRVAPVPKRIVIDGSLEV